jgi:lipopolysaccharide/colanic/teichoic acid biosynthesis glycosyltransferase
MVKRLFDILLSLIGLIVLSPFFVLIALAIVIDSRGGVFFRQLRVGRRGKGFLLNKFRSMRTGSDKTGLLTVGGDDSRITRVGAFLRKYKIDELPQLLNVLLGSMSLVGPRPEVRKFVDLYTEEQKKVLSVRPGITDYASLEYINENEILGKSAHPEETYVTEIMPDKLKLNLRYIAEQGFATDLKIIFRTIARIFSS